MDFIVCTDSDHVRMAQALRFSVYCEEKAWIDSKRCENGLEMDEYDPLAVHFLALQDGEPVGTSRLLLGTRQHLPAMEFIDLDALGLDPDFVVEVSRLAARRTGRSSDLRLFLGLTRLMWQWSMDRSMVAWLAIADVPLFRLLQRLKMPILSVAPHVQYMGSTCVPVAFDLPSTGASLQRSDTPD